MAKFTPGGRYIHSIRNHLSHSDRHDEKAPPFSQMRQRLDDPRMRRLIVDARQMAVFAEMAEPMPVLETLHLPFDEMYVEFTAPVQVTEIEPGYPDDLGTVAIILWKAGSRFASVDDSLERAVIECHAFVEGKAGVEWVDRSFGYDLSRGTGILSINRALDDPDPSFFPESFDTADGRMLIEARTEGRGIGWWERQVSTYADFLTSMLIYMTSQSVHIVEVPLSRQQRRAMERQSAKARPDHQPKAWHMVMVRPRRGAAPDSSAPGRAHSYRYDVIGHLKLGRHKLRDGSYREKVEWVRPHQRGLSNDLYIPSTYGYENTALNRAADLGLTFR